MLSFAVVKDNAQHNQRATAIAVNNMAVVAAGALLQPLVGFLLAHHASWRSAEYIRLYVSTDYQYALLILPLIYLIALILSVFFIRETYCRAKLEKQ